MSPLTVEAELRDRELRIAPAETSIMLGRRFLAVSGCCSVLDREPVEDIEPLFEPEDRLPLFHDFKIDLRTPFSEPGDDVGA